MLWNKNRLSSETIRLAYRFLLGREPESEAVISQKRHLGSIEALVEDIMRTPEFQSRVWTPGQTLNSWMGIEEKFASRLGEVNEYTVEFVTGLLLGRQSESEKDALSGSRAEDLQGLLQEVMQTEEFRNRARTRGQDYNDWMGIEEEFASRLDEVNEYTIKLAYKLLLGREPGSEQEIAGKRDVEDLDRLAEVLFRSQEFRNRISAPNSSVAEWIAIDEEIDRRLASVNDHTISLAYKLLLGRYPESPQVVADKRHFPDLDFLSNALMGSPEFQKRSRSAGDLVNKWVMIEHELGFRLWTNLADLAVSRAVMLNAYEPSEIKFVQNHLKPGQCAVDIGANIGFFTMLLSSIVGATGKVLAFEPLPFLFEATQKSCRENSFSHATVHNLALAAERGAAEVL